MNLEKEKIREQNLTETSGVEAQKTPMTLKGFEGLESMPRAMPRLATAVSVEETLSGLGGEDEEKTGVVVSDKRRHQLSSTSIKWSR